MRTRIASFVLAAVLLVSNTAWAYSDGLLDTTFDPGTGTNDIVRTLSIDEDGKLIIGGDFISYNATPRNYLARINQNGSLDTSFLSGFTMHANDTVLTTAIQTDGKILVGGRFATYGGTSVRNIVRVNTNGTLDTSFVFGSGTNGEVFSISLQPNGKIIIAGKFSSYNGTNRNGIARLNADGTLDTSFNPGSGIAATGTDEALVYSTVVQPDSKIIIAGKFSSYNGTNRNGIARLNADGTLDTSFNPGSGIDGSALTVSVAPYGKILLGGKFASYNGQIRNNIVRINTDGSLDTTFTSGFGTALDVYAVATQVDGKIILGGSFSSYGGQTRNNVVRIQTDGTLDTSFVSSQEFNKVVLALAIQPDSKIFIGGEFSSYNGVVRNNIARLANTTIISDLHLTSPVFAPDMTDATDTGSSNHDDITSDTTPDFKMICVSGNTVTLYIDGVSVLPTATCVGNTATINLTTPLSMATHTVAYTEKNSVGESGKSPILTIIVTVDAFAPILQEITPIGTTIDTTPNYTFSSDEAGTLIYGGACSSLTTQAIHGFNTITFNTLALGAYNNCTITVKDSSGNLSNVLAVTPFRIVTSAPPTQTPTTSETSTAGCTTSTQYSPVTGAQCPNYYAPTFVDTNPVICPHFTKYVKKGSPTNDQNEVMRWQEFLNRYENEFLVVDGNFGRRTFDAIRNFQAKYTREVLAPWGITAPTGYIYKSTRAKANKIFGCSEGQVILDNGQTVNY